MNSVSSRWFAPVLAVAVSVLGCGSGNGELPYRGSAEFPVVTYQSVQVEDIPAQLVQLDTLAVGLEVPWGGAVLGDGDLIFTEREGRIRRISGDTLLTDPRAVVAVRRNDPDWRPESGLLGVAVLQGTDGREEYAVMATRDRRAESRSGRIARAIADRVRSRLGRPTWRSENHLIVVRGAAGVTEEIALLPPIVTNHYHAGGAVARGPDGSLYVTVGDGTNPGSVGRVGSLTGAILRINVDGSIPSDNPFPGSRVYATGLRNSQGLAWHHESGTLFAVDHGPTGMRPEGGRMGNDELNIIYPGAHYGWPMEGGAWGAAHWVQPLVLWGEGIAPSGVVSLPTGDPERAELLVAALREHSLRWLTLARGAAGWSVVAERRLLRGTHGRFRFLGVDDSGDVYLSTSNRDGRGDPGPKDDMILRLKLPCGRPDAPCAGTTNR